MPGADALREASRRRRATGGPAEQTFATLVGLELRPRRLREAAALWWSVTEKRGVSGRDAIWSHPDLLPTADDLDDPLGFGDKRAAETDFTAPDDLSGLDEPGRRPSDDEPTPGETTATADPRRRAGSSPRGSSSRSSARSSAIGRLAAALTPSR